MNLLKNFDLVFLLGNEVTNILTKSNGLYIARQKAMEGLVGDFNN